jgi:hypothetical protein
MLKPFIKNKKSGIKRKIGQVVVKNWIKFKNVKDSELFYDYLIQLKTEKDLYDAINSVKVS